MKKILLILAAAIGCITSVRAQTVFHYKYHNTSRFYTDDTLASEKRETDGLVMGTHIRIAFSQDNCYLCDAEGKPVNLYVFCWCTPNKSDGGTSYFAGPSLVLSASDATIPLQVYVTDDRSVINFFSADDISDRLDTYTLDSNPDERLYERAEAADEPAEDDAIYHIVEEMPRFEGGDLYTFRDWVQARIEPKDREARVVVSFIVEKDGTLSGFESAQSPDSTLTEEVFRILRQSPRWTPGRQREREVRVKFLLPVEFGAKE